MIEIPQGDRVYFGQSFMGREGEDLVISVLVGDLSEADCVVLYDERDRLIEGLEYFLDLVDIRGFRSVAPAARKYALKKGLNTATRGIALVGGSFGAHTVLSMMLRALQLFDRRWELVPIRFFDDEAEARAWIALRRAVVRREKVG